MTSYDFVNSLKENIYSILEFKLFFNLTLSYYTTKIKIEFEIMHIA